MAFTRNIKLERMKSQIASDFAGALETAYRLPLMFSDPVKTGFFKYKTDIYVFEVSGKMYPFQVFSGTVVADEEKKCEVALLNSEYESLFDWIGKFDGEIVYGVKLDKPVGKTGLSRLLKKVDIEINTKDMTYSLGDPQSMSPQTTQPARI